MTTETNTKPVAKSLHTITVLLQVARLHMGSNRNSPEMAMTLAATTLGLANRPDPYGLIAKSLAQLQAEAK